MYSLSSNSNFFKAFRLVFRNVERGKAAPSVNAGQANGSKSAGERAKGTMSKAERLRKSAKAAAEAELKAYENGKKELTNLGLTKAMNKQLIPDVVALFRGDKRLQKLQSNISKAIFAARLKKTKSSDAYSNIELFQVMENTFVSKFNKFFKKNPSKAVKLLTRVYVYKKHGAQPTPSYIQAIKAVGGLKALISKKARKLAKIGSRIQIKSDG